MRGNRHKIGAVASARLHTELHSKLQRKASRARCRTQMTKATRGAARNSAWICNARSCMPIRIAGRRNTHSTHHVAKQPTAQNRAPRATYSVAHKVAHKSSVCVCVCVRATRCGTSHPSWPPRVQLPTPAREGRVLRHTSQRQEAWLCSLPVVHGTAVGVCPRTGTTAVTQTRSQSEDWQNGMSVTPCAVEYTTLKRTTLKLTGALNRDHSALDQTATLSQRDKVA